MPQFKIKPQENYSHSDKVSTFACTVPYKHIEIHTSGAISLCCHTWLPVWAGNLLYESVDDVLNNITRKQVQDDMRTGEFKYCNDHCPQLNSLMSGSKDYWDIIPIKQLDETLSYRPMNIGFSYDLSCNLQCPSCRDNLILWRPDDLEDSDGQRVKQIHEKVKELVNRMLEEHPIVNLNITGSGDAFASPLYWSYLLELANNPIHPNLRIQLKTNGVMMTEENLLDIKPLWKHIDYIEVSVDAATEEAYKIVRKNGNFKRLKKNLEVLDALVFNESFNKNFNWQTNFIVQRDNYKDLKDFVDWQLTYKSKPKIWTNLLAQWWHIDDERFKGMAVWQEGHVNRDELVQILKDPVFKNTQLKLGNMSSLVYGNQ